MLIEAMNDDVIIPYQELLGNYDVGFQQLLDLFIIPYQELLVNHPPPIKSR